MPEPISLTKAILIAIGTTAASTGINYLIAATQRKPDPLDINAHDRQTIKAEEGVPIPRVYGTDTVGGNCIWVPGSGTSAGGIEDVPTFTPGQGGKRRTPDTTTHSYYFNGAMGVCEGPILGITKIWANEKVIYTGGLGAITTGNIRIRLGNEIQTADSLIEADKGVGNTPAYRGIAHVVFEDFLLADFGDYVPNFKFEVVKDSSQTLAEVVEAECNLAGVTDAELNIGVLTDTVRGWTVNNRGPVRNTLDQLMTAFQFDLVEVDGKIKAIKRGQASSVTVALTELPAYKEGAEPPTRIGLVRQQAREIPRAVNVRFNNPARNFQPGSTAYWLQVIDSAEIATISLPAWVATEQEANRLARIIAVSGRTERVPVSFQLPWKYLKYHPGDVFTVATEGGTTYDVRITKMNFGLPGLIKFSGLVQDANTYTQTGTGSTDGASTGSVETPCVTFLGLGNLPPLRNHEDDGRPGYYYWGCPVDAGGCKWHGATLFWDIDGGGNYEAIASIQAPATAGQASTALATVVDTTVEDTVNTVDITLKYGTIASVTATAITNGANLAILGNEVIQFRTVTSLGGNSYRLSNLMRGRKQTADQVATHAINEDFVLVNEAVMRKIVDESIIGTSFNFKAVTSNSTLAATSAEAFTIGNKTFKPADLSGITASISSFKFESGSGVLILKVALATGRNTDTVQVRTSPGTSGVNDANYSDPYLIPVARNTTYSASTTPVVIEYGIKYDTAVKTHIWFELTPRNRNVSGTVATVSLDVTAVRANLTVISGPTLTSYRDTLRNQFTAVGSFEVTTNAYCNKIHIKFTGTGTAVPRERWFDVNPSTTYSGGTKLEVPGLTLAGTYNPINIDAFMGAIQGGGVGYGSDASTGTPAYSEVTGTTQTITEGNTYIANNAARIVFTLPTTATVGHSFRIIGKGAGGWKIAQNAGQQIRFGDVDTTTGTAGYIESNNTDDTIEVVCITTNTTWVVLDAGGTLTIE